jgi:NhaA family Na+:H+ antiporter
MSNSTLQRFSTMESVPGVLLLVATALAILLSNSPWGHWYAALLDLPIIVAAGDFSIHKPLLLWINDGLMAIFFLFIGLEVKRELIDGELASRDQVILPAVAALGGFALPALIYLLVNREDPQAIDGWAIPAATDIAFALGVLMLLGSRVPLALKVFLTSIAIFDDIAAIVVIAAFYTADLSLLSLGLGIGGLALLTLLNRWGVSKLGPYLLLGLVVWTCVLKSGVHATMAGFVLGLIIPYRASGREPAEYSPLVTLEHALKPWVGFAIMPIFAFANAGISFTGMGSEVLLSGVTLGIAAGLFLGKQTGVFLSVWLMVKLGFARLPAGATWLSIYGVALLTGIGFTMSLFIGSLAFAHGNFEHSVATRVGVMAGSLLSAIAGYLVLRRALAIRPAAPAANTGPLQSE